MPHSRFAIQANRSEVLFVDYIAEHLNPGGRAGIIVPEGIVFQSSNAYKNLRKMLVEDYLWAVVSLPAGVFNPYSGVKTSILLLDKRKSKESNSILFVKIENDGFDLGAQRGKIDKNDLPEALKILDSGEADNTEIAHWVEKSQIEESGDWNLSGERYKQIITISKDYAMVELGNVVEILDSLRKPITKSDRISGDIPYYGATGIVDYVNEYIFDERLVLLGEDGAKWSENEKTAFIAEGKYWVNNHAHVLRPKKEKLIDSYLVELLNVMDLNPYITGITVPKLNQKMMRSIQIPVPPLSVQEEIVAEIDGYQKIIDGARQVVENYKPTIKIDPEWEMVKLDEVCSKITDGSHHSPKTIASGIPYITVKDLDSGKIDFDNCKKISDEDYGRLKKNDCQPLLNDVLFSKDGTVGKTALIDFDKTFVVLSSLAIVRPNTSIVFSRYLYHIMSTDFFINKAINNKTGMAIRRIVLKALQTITIPLPSLSKQKEIVAQIEAEQEMVNANKKLIKIFEKKIKIRSGKFGVRINHHCSIIILKK